MKMNLNISSFLKGATTFTIGFLVLFFNVSIVNAQTVTVTGIDFGNFVTGGTGGTLTIANASTTTVTAGGSIIHMPNGTPHNGEITIVTGGGSNKNVVVTYSPANPKLTLGATQLTLALSPNSGFSTPYAKNTTMHIYIGGLLTIPSGVLPVGNYSAGSTISVTVAYN